MQSQIPVGAVSKGMISISISNGQVSVSDDQVSVSDSEAETQSPK